MPFDVVIAGGGPAGLSTSIHLRRRFGLNTLVLMKDTRKHSVGEVLPPIAKEELARLGVWEEFRHSCCVASAGISTWWGGAERRNWDYIFDPHGSGWNIDRRAFEALLFDMARSVGVEIVTVQRVHRCSRDNCGQWRVIANGIGESRATHIGRIFVNATGRGTQFAHVIGSKIHIDRLVACYQYVDTSGRVPQWEPRLWVEATAEGWWYSAPIPNDLAIAVYLTDSDLIGGNIPAFFQSQLKNAPNTLKRLRQTRMQGGIRVCSARSGVISEYRQQRALTVGDASYTTDPIRGHGLLQSLRQAAEASEAIAHCLGGDPQALASFNHMLRSRFREYQARLFEHYEMETRWRSSPFWVRRMRQ